jgi:hypothetical protein
MKGVTENGSAEASYYTWVDQFDVLGLGRNTPINTGNASEALLALKDGQFVIMRVPYPTASTRSGWTGRIDDPNAGWKGSRHLDHDQHARAFQWRRARGTTSKVIKFQ